MSTECVLKGGEMSCQLEDRLKNLETKVNAIEDKVGTTHGLVVEIRTILNTPSPIREEIAEVKNQLHLSEISIAKQDSNERNISDKIESIAKRVYEVQSKEALMKISIVVVILSSLISFLARQLPFPELNRQSEINHQQEQPQR